MKKTELHDMEERIRKADEASCTARRKVMRLKDELYRAQIAPALEALAGKCFRYRNSYSCPEKPSDYWYIYRRVVGHTDYSVTTFDVQRDSYGLIKIEPNSDTIFSTWGSVDSAEVKNRLGESISLRQFNAALGRTIKTIEKAKP